MAKQLLLFIFIINGFLASSSSISEEELNEIYSLLDTNHDSAYALSYSLLEVCNNEEDYYGLVKLNYILGYLHKQDGNVGKSVLHYLESIRFSKDANYDGLEKDAISIRKNLANLYRIYKAHDLAITYFNEAIEIADWTNNQKQLVSLKFNLALTLQQNNQSALAISTFKEILNLSSDKRKKRIINELGLIHWGLEDYENAKMYFNQLLEIDEGSELYSAKAMHNLGEIEFESGNMEKGIELIRNAINLKLKINSEDQRSLFISYKKLGDFLYAKLDFSGAKNAYSMAEDLVSAVKHDVYSYELYRSISQLNYELGDPQNGKLYSNLYSKRVDEYIESQQLLQETDRQYNMDLITKRYLDQVDKQEQIASILLYSKVISGSLLALLLLTIGINWYQKVQLRKSIVRDLINLKVVD